MLSVDLRYNALKEKKLNDFIIGVVFSDERRQGSLEITLCDIDRRFSVGQWRAYIGDNIECILGGVSYGTYMIKSIIVRRSPACVVWKCTGKIRASSSGSSPTTGKKIPASVYEMDSKINIFGGASSVPSGTRFKALLSEMSRASGITFRSALNKARPSLVSQKGALQVNFDCSGKDIPPLYSYRDFCNDLCARCCIDFHCDAKSLTFIERAAVKGKDIKKDITITPVDLVDIQNETSVTITRAKARSYDINTKKAQAVDIEDETDGELATVWGYTNNKNLSMAVGDALLDGKTGEVSIVPQAGVMAGGRVEIYGNIYDILTMNYTQNSGSEHMQLKIRRAA